MLPHFWAVPSMLAIAGRAEIKQIESDTVPWLSKTLNGLNIEYGP